jgi:hypothetical protein
MEVVGHKVFNTPYANVYALAIEPAAMRLSLTRLKNNSVSRGYSSL